MATRAERKSNARLVYSDDPKDMFKFIAVMRIENKGRGGKTVTVIDKLPKNEKLVKELATELKAKCGAGGSHNLDGSHAVIEIQGDQREKIRPLLEKRGISVTG